MTAAAASPWVVAPTPEGAFTQPLYCRLDGAECRFLDDALRRDLERQAAAEAAAVAPNPDDAFPEEAAP